MSQLDQDEKLIIEVQQYTGLYDQKSFDYRDLRKKENMWQAVAESLGLHARECQARWRVLRDKFVREMRKNVNSKKAGPGALQVYQGSWPLMSQLMFLTSHVKHRPFKTTKQDSYSDPGASEDEDEPEISDEEEPEMKHNPSSNGTPLAGLPNKKIKTQEWDLDSFRYNGQGDAELTAAVQGVEEEDGERLFCLSLVPALKRLDPETRSLAKINIQKLLHNLEFPHVKFET